MEKFAPEIEARKISTGPLSVRTVNESRTKVGDVVDAKSIGEVLFADEATGEEVVVLSSGQEVTVDTDLKVVEAHIERGEE